MAATAVTLADALLTAWLAAYAGGRISRDVHVERTYTRVPEEKLKDLADWSAAGGQQSGVIRVYLQIDEESVDTDEMTRGELLVDFKIQVGVACRAKDTTPANIDPLKLLTQQLRDYCFQRSPAYSLGADLPGAVAIENLFDPHLPMLRNERLFLSAFALKFLGGRSLV